MANMVELNKKIRRHLWNIISSGLPFDYDLDILRKFFLLNLIIILGIIFLGILAIIAFIQKDLILGFADSAMLLFLIWLVYTLRKNKCYKFVGLLGTAITGFFYLFLIVHGGIERTAYLWIFTYPLIVLYLLGKKLGTYFATLFFCMICILLFLGWHIDSFQYYSINIIIRLLSVYAIIYLISFVTEVVREKSQDKLEKSRNELQDTFKILQRSKNDIAESNQKLLSEIDERKRIEKTLRNSEKKYRDLVENINEVIFSVDKTGLITYVSPAVEPMLGYTPSEIIGKQIQEVIYKEDVQMVMGSFQKILTGIINPSEYRLYKKSGKLCWVQSSSKPIFNKKDVCGLQGVLTDIDDRKRAEEEKIYLEKKLIRSQKMEALGLLAGGVAHDLNNVLSGTINYPELLLMSLPEESPMRKPIQAIMDSGLKAVAIVQDLLDLTRRGVIVNQTLNLNDIISDHLSSPEHKKMISYHPGVDIETHFEPALLNIKGSPVHLKKAVMNLFSNAAEALSGGGRITVSTENRYIDRPIKGYEHIDEGDFTVLRIQDNGIGIATEDLNNIFEPFYTKKEMGRSGTGLGMTIVWNTVQDHQGYINLESTVGKGTSFELYFPVTRKEVAKENVSTPLKDYMGKGETILVIDDIKEQREVAFEILKELGYLVTSVSSGEEAVEYIKNNSVDLLILDMIMNPGMDGLDTYQKILEIHPGQKAIVASGFSETDRVKEVQRLGAGAYIKKPYTLDKIGLAVKAELER
jgi:two-component system, cell cycle sensor histidine kinase and response regulator CckA